MSRKIRDAFDSVKADEQMKEKTKETLIAQLDSCSKRRFYQRPVFYRTLAGALLLVLVFAGSMRAYEIKAEAAYITMEGPVEIGLSVKRQRNGDFSGGSERRRREHNLPGGCDGNALPGSAAGHYGDRFLSGVPGG